MHAGFITDFESVGMRATDAGFLKLAYQRVASNFECPMRDKACGQSRGTFCGQCAEELARGAAHTCDASVLFFGDCNALLHAGCMGCLKRNTKILQKTCRAGMHPPMPSVRGRL